MQSAFASMASLVEDAARAWTGLAEAITRALNVTDQAKLDNFTSKLLNMQEQLAAMDKPGAMASFDKWLSPEAWDKRRRDLERGIAELQPKIAELQQKIAGASNPAASAKPALPTLQLGPGGAGGAGADTSGVAEARDLERELNEELRAQVELIQSAAGVSDAYYARLAADARLALTQGKITLEPGAGDAARARGREIRAPAQGGARRRGDALRPGRDAICAARGPQESG